MNSAPLVPLIAGSNSSISDDEHDMRLLNGTTGTAIGLTLNADFSVLANNVLQGQASTSGLATANSAMRVEVTSSVSQQSLYLQTGLNIPGSGVYTMFMLGDSTAPTGVLRKDR
jgi:hypothetical protein